MITVNGLRMLRDLEMLGQIGRDAATGGVNRAAFSAADVQARGWYRQRCTDAGLAVATDAFGNMTARRQKDDGTSGAVCSGSHIDAVPNGGTLDGALGTVAALECLRRIDEEDLELASPVRALVFSDEEGCYGHLFGSYGMVHGYDVRTVDAMTGRRGDRLVHTWADFPYRAQVAHGTDGSRAPYAPADPKRITHFVELHIEQGPYLEKAGVDIGVVSSIVGLGGGRLEFHGRADHAGTTPMTMRSDALLAAATFLEKLPALAASVSDTAVATCGIVDVEPSSSNVVPELVTLTVDLRDPSRAKVEKLHKLVGHAAAMVAADTGTSATFTQDIIIDPVPLDHAVRQIIRDVADARGYRWQDMPSGAGHDSQNISTIAPTGMIFVPSHLGRSHCPDEYTDPELLVQGASTLLATLVALAS